MHTMGQQVQEGAVQFWAKNIILKHLNSNIYTLYELIQEIQNVHILPKNQYTVPPAHTLHHFLVVCSD